MAPVEIAQDRFSDIDLYLEAGRDRRATLLLDSLQSQLPPALADFQVPRWRIRLALGAEDGGLARVAYDAAIDAMEANVAWDRSGHTGDVPRGNLPGGGV